MSNDNITRLPLPAGANLPVLRESGNHLSTEVIRQLPADNETLDAGRLWRVLRRYRRVIFCSMAAFGVLAFIYSFLLRPMYTATSTVRVNQNTSIVNVGSDIAGAIGGFSEGRSWNATATSIKLLEGRGIGKELIKDSDLGHDSEFIGELSQRRLIPGPGILVAGRNLFYSSSPQPATAEPSEQVLDNATSIYMNNVAIEPVEQTDLLRISYTSFKPETAAKVVNNLVNTFNRVEAESQRALALSAQEVLNAELQNVQSRLQLSERKLTEFFRKTGLVDLEDSNNIMNSQTLSISAALLEVQRKRRDLGILIANARNVDDKSVLPSLLKNERITQLEGELAGLSSKYQELSAVFKEDFPELKALQGQMGILRTYINTEVNSAISMLATEYKILTDQEQTLMEALDNNNSELLNLKDRSIAYNVLKREQESYKNLYAGLLEKVKRAVLAANLEANRLSLLEAAPVPLNKSFPNIPKNIVVAVSFGGMFGLVLAFVMALKDRQFRSVKDVEEYSQLSVLSVIPLMGDGDTVTRKDMALQTYHDPTGTVAETFRSFRTSLLYSMPGVELDILMITSAGPSEGKTSSVVNLATAYAKNDLRVLLIDFDLRKPALHKVMEMARVPGVTDALVSGTANIRKTEISNVFVLTAGTNCPNPTEVLESLACRNLVAKLKDAFDIVLFDAPPVMGLADALVLSQYVKALVLAMDASQTNKDLLKGATNRLRRVNAPISGILMTKYSADQADDYEYGGDYYSNYYYGYSYGHDHDVALEDQSPGGTRGKNHKNRAKGRKQKMLSGLLRSR